MKEVLKVSNLNKSLGKNLINDLSFSISEGSVNAFLCSGKSGKTTLIKLLTGIMYADSGKVEIDGIEVKKKNLPDFVIKISTILDDIDDQFVCNKVLDELKFPLENLEYDSITIDEIIENVSDLVDIKQILGKDNSRLSYFQKVKVLLGASIVHSPKIIFLDDIFRLLNKKEKESVRKLISRINRKLNIAIVLATSDLEDVIDYPNIMVLKDGKIFIKGMYEKILEKDNELVKLGIRVPMMVDLSVKLKFYDLVDEIYYDPDKVVDKLWN